MGYEIDGIKVACDNIISEDEAREYVKRGLEKHPGLYEVILAVDEEDEGYVGVTYNYKEYRMGEENGVPFDRIRRVTGYLSGTLDRFNDAKRAEEADRVKHCVSC